MPPLLRLTEQYCHSLCYPPAPPNPAIIFILQIPNRPNVPCNVGKSMVCIVLNFTAGLKGNCWVDLFAPRVSDQLRKWDIPPIASGSLAAPAPTPVLLPASSVKKAGQGDTTGSTMFLSSLSANRATASASGNAAALLATGCDPALVDVTDGFQHR